MTGGDAPLASGSARMSPRRLRMLLVAAMMAYGAMQSFVNGASRQADLASAGRFQPVWMTVVEEASSFVTWSALVLVVWHLVRLLRPPRFGWTLAVGLHALATVPVSLAHVSTMFGLRWLAFALVGEDYAVWRRLAEESFYEYRKDAATYVLLALACAAIQWAVARQAAKLAASPSPVAREDPMLDVPDGAVTHHVPLAEIDHIESSGNYVTLHWQQRALLHRATLSALEAQLAPYGFVRIHRSRMVRRAAVRRMENISGGDFTVTLADGTQLRGSRRFRDGIRAGSTDSAATGELGL